MKVKVKKGLIKQLRTNKSWTQEEFAEASCVHSRTIQRMENEGMVSTKTLNAVAKALDVEPYTLEFSTDEIDFGPLWIELRIVVLAITRRLIPLDDRELPNSLVAVLSLLSFSASFTLINAIVMLVNQPQKNFDSLATSGIFGLVLLFCLIYAGVVYPLFKLKPWARSIMIVICGSFFLINGGLLLSMIIETAASNTENFVNNMSYSHLLEYSVNLFIVFWIYRILNRADIKRLYNSSRAPET